MKIAIFALLMVVVLTLVESQLGNPRCHGIQKRPGIDAVDELRSKRDLIDILVQRNSGNGRRRQRRDINQKHQSVNVNCIKNSLMKFLDLIILVYCLLILFVCLFACVLVYF
jgi:hypothetical protein